MSDFDGAGPKPDDYLMIHVRAHGVIELQQVTHYINHAGIWTPRPGAYKASMPLPGPKYSQFVCLPLPESTNAKHRKII